RARCQRHVPFDALLSQCRHSSWNLTVNWNVGNPNLHGWRNQRSRFARMPVEKPFSLQCRDVLHHRCLAGEAEMILDFARAWRNAFLALLTLNKIKHPPLPVGQHLEMILQTAQDASSGEHVRSSFQAKSRNPV